MSADRSLSDLCIRLYLLVGQEVGHLSDPVLHPFSDQIACASWDLGILGQNTETVIRGFSKKRPVLGGQSVSTCVSDGVRMILTPC